MEETRFERARRYERAAAAMGTYELRCALADVCRTLDGYRDADPASGYAGKLWLEFDAYSVELHKRDRVKGAA